MTYCKDCGGFLNSRKMLADYCPVCTAASWRRFRKRSFWGGIISLALLAGMYFLVSPRAWDEWEPILGIWSFITLLIFLSLGGFFGYGSVGGNGGGGNGGG